MMKDMETLYQERIDRVAAASRLESVDRVPIVPCFQAYPVYYANKWTIADLMADYRRCTDVYDTFYAHFSPDLGWDPILFYPTDYMKRLGITWVRWPGEQIREANTMYQYVEDQFMKEDEYPEAIEDLTKFMMNKWYPRSFTKLSGMKKLDFRKGMWLGHMSEIAAFADPEVRASMEALMDAGKMLTDWYQYLDEYQQHMRKKFGMPPMYAGFAFAPFDKIGDNMRGTVDIMTDLYDHPDELLELIDIVTDFAIKDTIEGAKGKAVPYVWFWLHKGIDSFMSDAQFAKFYWPSLLKYITALTEAGLTPLLYVEGAYNSRLDFLRDVPKKKVIFDFEYTDIAAAKKALDGHACVMGNVPAHLLSYGTVDEVRDYCKWLIDTCAPGGGFIMDSGTMIDDAKTENIEAMFDTTFTYGKGK